MFLFPLGCVFVFSEGAAALGARPRTALAVHSLDVSFSFGLCFCFLGRGGCAGSASTHCIGCAFIGCFFFLWVVFLFSRKGRLRWERVHALHWLCIHWMFLFPLGCVFVFSEGAAAL